MLIKIEDLLKETVGKNRIWEHITDGSGRNLYKILEELPKYELKQTKKENKKNDNSK